MTLRQEKSYGSSLGAGTSRNRMVFGISRCRWGFSKYVREHAIIIAELVTGECINNP